MSQECSAPRGSYWGAGTVFGQPVVMGIGAVVFAVLLGNELSGPTSWTSILILAGMGFLMTGLWLRPRVVISEQDVTFYSWFQKATLSRSEAVAALHSVSARPVWYMHGVRIPFLNVPSGRDIRLPAFLEVTPSLCGRRIGRYLGSLEVLTAAIETR